MSHQHCLILFFCTENREDMLSPANNKLTDVLEEANRLFVNGRLSLGNRDRRTIECMMSIFVTVVH